MFNKKECVAMLLAGGQGSRLYVLTQNMAKPAVPFGGKYRIIDFPLSNCVNSGIDTVGVLTQYQPLVLNQYLADGQPWDLDRIHGGVHVLPPYQTALGADWYKGTANATVTFAFQGENRFAGQDFRPLKFRVCGMRLEADGVEPLTQAEIYGTEHNFMAISQWVHSCLHRHGFFTVASALCVNRGWFSKTELVSDYYMGDHYLQRMNRQEEAVDYILENRFDRVAFLYTACRKAKKEEYDG